MEFVQMKCPACMGALTFLDANTVRCDSCGAMFAVERQGSAAPAQPERRPIDVEAYIEDMASKVRYAKLEEFAVGRAAVSAQPAKRIRNMYRFFEIPADEDILMFCDTTMRASGKIGFAITKSGMYARDEDGTVAYLNWKEFADRDVQQKDDTYWYVGELEFISDTTELTKMFNLFQTFNIAVYNHGVL